MTHFHVKRCYNLLFKLVKNTICCCQDDDTGMIHLQDDKKKMVYDPFVGKRQGY